MNERDFFQEATLCLCRSLELERSLWHCLGYLKRSFPLHAVALGCIDGEAGAERVLVMATPEEGRQLDLVLPQSEDRPGTIQIAGKIGELLGLGPDYSMVVLPLELEGRRLGAARFLARGRDRYGQGHADRLALITGPLGLALANHLHQRRLTELTGAHAGRALKLDQVVAGHIRHVMELTAGRIEGRQGAAELLDVHPSTLRKRMRRLQIPFGRTARRKDRATRQTNSLNVFPGDK